MKAVKKIILLALAALMMAGCKEVTDEKVYVKEGERIISIDSCEYIERPVYYGTMLTHKGNCRFCAERRNQKLKELVEQLKGK